MMGRLQLFAVLLCLGLLHAVAWAGPSEDQRARNAVRVLNEIQRIPEQSIPTWLLDEGRAIIIIPDTIKAGLIFGGRHGRGVMSVKTNDGTWSNPVFVKFTGGSFGFQAGIQFSDIVLVFRNDRTLDNIVNGKFTLGADASVAAGPVGRNAVVATDGQFNAEIWSWSRARGLFAGIALDGAALHIDDAANIQTYGPRTTARMIFENRFERTPSADLIAFRDRLEEAAYSAHNRRASSSITPAPSPAPTTTTAPTATRPTYVTPPSVSSSAPAEVQVDVYPLSADSADNAQTSAQPGFVPVPRAETPPESAVLQPGQIHTEALD